MPLPSQNGPVKDNGTPLDGGMNPRSATSYIEDLLDDNGHTADHIDRTAGDEEVPDTDSQEGVVEPEPDSTDSDDPDSTDEQTVDEGSEDDEGDINAESDEQDGEAITTLQELAQALDMSIDDLKSSITHTFKAAGNEQSLTLAELETGYQLRADYDRDKTQLAESRREFEQQQQQRVAEYTQNANAMAQMFTNMEQQLLAQYQAPELQQLRTSDPAEWSARMYEGQQKLDQLRQQRDNAAVQYDQFINNERQHFLAAEGQKLAQNVDGWGDDKLKGAVDTIKTLGFSDEEVINVVDSRLITGALELQTLRAENEALKAKIESADKAVNKVKKTVPKTVKAGKPISTAKGAVQRNQVNKLRKRLKTSGNVADAAALIENMI